MIPIDSALETAISTVMTCAPQNCLHEAACFKLARFAREQIRAAVPPPPPPAPVDPDEVQHYAPAFLDARIGGWEAA